MGFCSRCGLGSSKDDADCKDVNCHRPVFEPRWFDLVRLEAMTSRCKKSRRGVILLNHGGFMVASASNGPPIGGRVKFACDGSKECRLNCNKVAMHAEERALQHARFGYIHHLIHMKVDDDGKPLRSGPPSCWQCSRMIVESSVRWVWLFHEDGWFPYTPEEFHELTLVNCGLPVVKEEI